MVHLKYLKRDKHCVESILGQHLCRNTLLSVYVFTVYKRLYCHSNWLIRCVFEQNICKTL